MTLEQLKYLKAIVDTGSFRAAADISFRSQSSLSISIKKLEQELGIEIFTRENYRPKLTTAGKAIYEKAIVLLQKNDELKDFAEHLSQGFEPEIRLAVSGAVPIEPIIRVLNKVGDDFPHTRISILIENLNGTIERIHDDDADLAITDSSNFAANLESIPLTVISFVGVVPATSRWSKVATTVCIQDLEKETLIVVRDTSYHSERDSKGILQGALQWVVNDFSTKKRIICSGKGWGRMPLHLVADDLKSGSLVQLSSADFPPLTASVSLTRKKNRFIGPVEETLWKELAKAQF